jgi:type 1 glutamine amidotransferase
MNGKRILLVLGGTWHDFEGFAATMEPVMKAAGHTVETTYDLDALTRLDEERYDVVLLCTCLGVPEEGENDPVPAGHTDAQVEALSTWVRSGGGLLAAHAATVAGQSNAVLRELMGGVFVSHPPRFTFAVYPMYRRHPITDGVEAFTVHDEFYVEVHELSVDVHMVAIDRGVAYPMVWTKNVGAGRVAHVGMGHDEKVWCLGPYQRVMLQAVAWLAA